MTWRLLNTSFFYFSVHPDDASETLSLWNSCLRNAHGGALDIRKPVELFRAIQTDTGFLGWLDGKWSKIQVEPLKGQLVCPGARHVSNLMSSLHQMA